MMKQIKRMLFDCVSSASTSAVVSTPINLVHFETFLGTFLRSIHMLVSRPANGLSAAATFFRVDARAKNRWFNVPLIKASTRIMASGGAGFSGRTVLCVGGIKYLYPAYRQIIEDENAHFLSFHGSYDAPIIDLHRLLEKSDLIICPIDCIRHEAFWITKRHCERLCKPFVMLDKSRITTFYNGIRMLKNLQ